MSAKKILAIDPGNIESGFALIALEDLRPIMVGKIGNEQMRDELAFHAKWKDTELVIEMVASYGMPVGASVFQTCVWIGKFLEAARREQMSASLLYRRDVKLNLCQSARAKDANVIQALVDRFAPGASNHGKGTKKDPGWFYGFKADVWQAYALAVTYVDLEKVVRW